MVGVSRRIGYGMGQERLAATGGIVPRPETLEPQSNTRIGAWGANGTVLPGPKSRKSGVSRL